MLKSGELDDKEIEVELNMPVIGVEIMAPPGMEEMTSQLQNMFQNVSGGKKRTRKLKVGEALKLLTEEEAAKLVNEDDIKLRALDALEQNGLVFLDELDKVCGRSETAGPDVSREGVQRDLLPLVEGSTVSTKYGMVKTDHILFIASGAFHLAKPSDLIPELQGRLPIRVELRLARDVDRIDLFVDASNTVRDHRLRVHLRAPFAARHFEVESALEVAARPIDPAPGDFGRERPAEFPTGATPQRSFASVSDGRTALTVANRGSPEVEAVPEPDGTCSLAVTILRTVGRLSREDLAPRPGHAGPGIATPGAQVPGPHRAELSYRLHPADQRTRSAEAHRFAFPPLMFPAGSSDGMLRDGERLLEVDDPEVVVSAVEPGRPGAEPRGATIRIVNLSHDERHVRLRWNGSVTGKLTPVDLNDSPCDPKRCERLEETGRAVYRVALRPWEIATFKA